MSRAQQTPAAGDGAKYVADAAKPQANGPGEAQVGEVIGAAGWWLHPLRRAGRVVRAPAGYVWTAIAAGILATVVARRLVNIVDVFKFFFLVYFILVSNEDHPIDLIDVFNFFFVIANQQEVTDLIHIFEVFLFLKLIRSEVAMTPVMRPSRFGM